MKTFRLIGMALLAILGSMNFIACGSDDEKEELIKNEDGVITNQKRLTRIEMVNDGISTLTFSYDSKGRVVFKKGGVTGDTNYTWGNNIIMATDDNESTRTYILSNNLVKNINDNDYGYWGNTTFSYNSNNQLTKVLQDSEEYGTNTESYTWQGNKISKLAHQYREECIYEYTYSGKTCKGYFPLYIPSENDEIFYAHPELVGLRCSQLPDKVYGKDSYSEETEQYTYTFDNDGYIESCTAVYTEKSSDRTHTYTIIYTFTWE